MAPMRRLAWFTPFPPVRSGISDYSAEVLPLVSDHARIDVFVDERAVPTAPASIVADGAHPVRIRPAHEFVWRQFRHPYDLAVYQMGNAACHDFMWPFLVRYPGLVVLHDGQLHQARARLLFDHSRFDEYRAEFRFAHPATPPELPDMFMTSYGGTLFYIWPMVGTVVRTARLVAVHSAHLARSLRADFPSAVVETIRMGVADRPATVPAREIRARHGLPPDALVLTAFGNVTPEKRIASVLRAVVPLARQMPGLRLLLVGDTVDYYDVGAQAAALGLGGRTVVTGFVDDAELGSYLEASDVCLCLRWPSGRETSASWLRCLAAARPTIITDLAHIDDVPAYDPRSWTVLEPYAGDEKPEGTALSGPCCVTIDLLDEVHSLTIALRRLLTDSRLRDSLGRAARRWWEQHHTLECMADDYRRVTARAIEIPAGHPDDLPAHLVADGLGLARSLTATFGINLRL